jgi:hypothetical protein
MNKLTIETMFRSQREKSVNISKLAVILAMGCVSYGYAQFIARLGLQANYLTLFGLLISIEAIYTHLHAKDVEDRERTIFRAAEILTILILFKVFLLLHNGVDGLFAEILAWQDNFLGTFFTGEYLAGLFIFAPIWAFSTILAGDIETLHDHEQDTSWDELGIVQNTLHLYRRRIAANLFFLGGLVVFFAIGARMNFRDYVPFVQGKFNPDVPIANVLIYFILVLVLLSQSHFALLRTRWLWNKTPIAPRLSRNWLIYGGIFFGAIAFIAFFLPTNYSLGFFETLLYSVNLLMFIFRLIVALFLLPLSFCANLFKSNPSSLSQDPQPSIPEMPPAPLVSAANPFWQFVQSLLFWATLIGVVTFALSQYIRTNKTLWAMLSRVRLPSFFQSTIQAILVWLRHANRAVITAVADSLKRLRPPSEAVRSLERRIRQPGGLTPREQVIQLYLTLLQLSREEGAPRKPGETPHQFSQNLITEYPNIAPDLLEVTDAFIEARYSQHPIPAEKVPPLQSAWGHIRDHFRKPIKP